VVRVRFNDPGNLASCEEFLQHAFPGAVDRDGQELDLTFETGSLQPPAQRKVVERLLWAWRVSHHLGTEDGVVIAPEQTGSER
jgi:hypothetical protein